VIVFILSVSGAIGNPVNPTSGGTGVSNPTANSIAIAEGSSNFNFIAPTATVGQVLMNQGLGLDPAYSTASYPLTTTINQILFSSAVNTVSGLSTANNGVLVTSSSGVPTLLAGPGATGRILQSNAAAAPSFSTASYPSTAGTLGTLLRSDGTNFVNTAATFANTYTANNLLYSIGSNAVTGLATANSGVLTTSTTGVPSIDTTNFQVLTTGVQIKGNNTNTAPPAGFIGQQIVSSVVRASAISSATAAVTNITSISLTAGIWDISMIGCLKGPTTGTDFLIAISANSASFTGTVQGDSQINFPFLTTVNADMILVIPSFRVTLSGTTTYFAVAQADYTVGTGTIYGRISATRVG